MARYIVAAVNEIPPGGRKIVTVAGRSIGVFNVAGEFFALRNRCPHQGGPLCEGWVEDKAVTCPWHSWTFDLESGKMPLDDTSVLDVFDVRVEDGEVMVGRTPRPS